ncbi:MAG: hypothetical protein D8M58_01425 [Calditrichaeota bacterium]|nr:MAG: hypothetical protein DWQ03_05655 [Calditrichota bacterium]MBL1204030.1 hypothetical protein [Calditrichota bacterium]NOG43861.1 peptidoglycan DD-metalloendopeptidase family protein [Calditrichota bacterium]
MKKNPFQNSNTEVVQKNDTNSFEIIQQQVDSYITKRKIWDSLRRRLTGVLFVLILAVSALLYSGEIINLVKTLAMNDVELLLTEDAALIKKSAMKLVPKTYFSGLELPKNESLTEETKYAFLIHKLNNDFYGSAYNLALLDERYLYTHISMAGLNYADLSNLNRPFSDDSSQTLKKWLFNKTNSSLMNSAYYNPIFQKLSDEINSLQKQLSEKLSEPFPTEVQDIAKHILVKNNKNELERDELKAELASLFSTNPVLIKDELELEQQLAEKKQELNLRLGLFQVYLGKEYKTRRSQDVYGWLNGDYKGKNYFASKGRKYKNLIDNTKYSGVENFVSTFKYNNRVYKKLDLWDKTIRLYNPLRMPLEVKNVGLFGARRKSERGRFYKHKGIDLIADEGTPVYPVKDGFVVFVGNKRNGHGNHIKIIHDNRIVSLYSHLKDDRIWERTLSRFRSEGPFWINTLSPLASVGTTGNIPSNDAQYGYAHLHLEVEVHGKLENPFQMFKESFKVYQE